MRRTRRIAGTAIPVLCAFVVASCGAPATPTPTHTSDHVAEGTAVTVPALWASKTGQSGVEHATVTVGTVGDPGFSIDLADEQAQGAGAQWTAASASAAAVATIWSGVDPALVDVRYEVTGPIDGPSAGGILAVGTLAAIRGDALDPMVTMTGTISPDGSIGPVGGVGLKLHAAADEGFTTVLIPQRNADTVSDTGTLIDEGAALGLTVRPIRTLLDAYAAFTGVTLATSDCTIPVDPAVVAAANDATLGPATTTGTTVAQRAAQVSAAAQALITGVLSADTDVNALARDQLAALPALLAPVMRADMLARAVDDWARTHPDDVTGLEEADALVTVADATLRTVPVSIAAWRALPPDVPIDPVRAAQTAQAYAGLLRTAANATATYMDAVLGLHASAQNTDASTLIAAGLADIATADAAMTSTDDLTGAVLTTSRALAAWTTEQQVSDVASLNFGAGDAELGTRTAVQLVNAASCRASAAGLDPSWPVWSTRTAVELAEHAPVQDARRFWLAATATASEAQLAVAMQSAHPPTA